MLVLIIITAPIGYSIAAAFPFPLRVPLVSSFNIGPNVCPSSILTLTEGSFAVWFLSHHVIITFPPSADISASTESVVVLLRLIFSPKVCPPSVEARKIYFIISCLVAPACNVNIVARDNNRCFRNPPEEATKAAACFY